MAEAHHDDHGNTPAAWFLTISWIAVWTGGAIMIMMDGSVLLWSVVTLAASAVCAAVAGVMKKAGLGRQTPRLPVVAPAADVEKADGPEAEERNEEAETAAAGGR